jgi:hypothetical protein
LTSGPAIVLYIAAIELVAQLTTAFRYGIFRDELYYIACSEHLAWGYVDQPPLIAFITWLERHIGGDSLLSLRFLPALAGAATVWLAGRMARQLGGRRYAQVLAALAVLIAPGYLAFYHLLTMNAFEPLIWTAAAYVVLRVIQTGNQRLWLWFGVLAGLGLENKYSMLLFGFGIFIGLLLTRERKALARPWIWLAAGIAALIWLPNVVWNIQHHWPFLELMRNIRASGRDVVLNPLAFVAQQVLSMHPLTAPIWIAGLLWCFFGATKASANARGTQHRRGSCVIFGWTALVVLFTLIALKGKVYYAWPVFPILFAAGGVAVEGWLQRWRWAPPVYVTLLAAGGAFMAPMFLPVLSPERFLWYETKFHMAPPQMEHQRLGPLRHQIYADMFGWEDVARAAARAYYSLPAGIRQRTAIAGSNYGSAGAIDFFGPKYGLPKAIAGHQSYWLWGPRNYTGESVLLLDGMKLCDAPQRMGRVENYYSRGDQHWEIYWCHPLRWNLQKDWAKAKHWD